MRQVRPRAAVPLAAAGVLAGRAGRAKAASAAVELPEGDPLGARCRASTCGKLVRMAALGEVCRATWRDFMTSARGSQSTSPFWKPVSSTRSGYPRGYPEQAAEGRPKSSNSWHSVTCLPYQKHECRVSGGGRCPTDLLPAGISCQRTPCRGARSPEYRGASLRALHGSCSLFNHSARRVTAKPSGCSPVACPRVFLARGGERRPASHVSVTCTARDQLAQTVCWPRCRVRVRLFV